ncbi:uncharacterized protein LOC135847616 isoform X10 [Planococcus citri]|uniref:uncharacterized protein LOC135847616 isoform X10 n=1 Tax=Planococcus citri TaxID=170843 RepID=UPI0031F862B4
MAEIPPVVYDIAQPSPVSLKDLSAIAVSLEMWRNEIRKRRTNSTIERFTSLSWDISLETVLDRDLPSVLYDAIHEFIPRFRPSLYFWLVTHRNIFQLYRDHENSVLKVFDDFVADYCGTIDYVRTAKRMLVCDTFNEVEKFAIACTYFFEDDIRRIWPSVCESFDLNSMNFIERPPLYYWICCLRNEMDKMPIQGNLSVDEVMVHLHFVHNRPSLEYFWNRLPVENQMERAVNVFNRGDLKLFVTFVLSKLNDQQLDGFVNTYGCRLILNLQNDHSWFFQPTLKLFKNKMNESTFRTLVIEMLKLERALDFEWCPKKCQEWLYYCSEIWNSIPPNLKPSIIEGILSDRGLYENMGLFSCGNRRFVGFLLIILSSATFEQRSAFWRDCWTHLIQGTRSRDLFKIMKLCFANEEEIAQFKGNILAESENVRLLCSELLNIAKFDHLNDLVNFCWPEVEAAKNFKQQLTRSTLSGENDRFMSAIVNKAKEFSLFIDDVLDNADESADFKNQLMSSPVLLNFVSRRPCSILPDDFEAVMELVDTFVSTEQTLHAIKTRMIRYLGEFILNRRQIGDLIDQRFEQPIFDQFLLWLLGSAEEVERFKQTHFI